MSEPAAARGQAKTFMQGTKLMSTMAGTRPGLADLGCATRFSLVRGAMGAASCKAPMDGGVGGPRAYRGPCTPPAGAVAPHPLLSTTQITGPAREAGLKEENR